MDFFVLSYVLIVSLSLEHSHGSVNKSEPIRSKFNFEEKLYEKINGIEMKMEEISGRFKDTEKEMSQKVKTLEESIIQYQRVVKQKMIRCDEEMAKLIALVDERSFDIVAFEVRLSTTRRISGRVVYDTVITNKGEGYDKSTGMFTAPYTGLYFFSAHVCSHCNRYVRYSIFHDGTPMTNGTQYDGSGMSSCSSLTTVVMVNKAERVWVQCINKAELPTEPYRWNTFSGFLVNKLLQ